MVLKMGMMEKANWQGMEISDLPHDPESSLLDENPTEIFTGLSQRPVRKKFTLPQNQELKTTDLLGGGVVEIMV